MQNLTVLFFLAVLFSCGGQPISMAEKEPERDNSSTAPDPSMEMKEGIIYFSADQGLSWEDKSDGLPPDATLGLGAIAVSDKFLGIATQAHGVYLFDFQQDLWVSIPTDRQMLASHPGALAFYQDQLYVGTQSGGVFSSADQGKSWTAHHQGLDNLTIRKLVQLGDTLYAGTNAGLYAYSKSLKRWELEYGNSTLQVNGITAFDGDIYMGTNQGIFTTPQGQQQWMKVLDNHSIHNISADDKVIYAMTYNALLSSADKGQSWQNIQKGLPAQLYTFNIIKHGNAVFAGQWDGVYRKDSAGESWKAYSKGLPEEFAITNMKSYRQMLVVSGNPRKLSPGMTTDK